MKEKSLDLRIEQLRQWLASSVQEYALLPATLQSASVDASFRRYFRVLTENPLQPSLIIMDAPPEHEDCAPFVAIAKRLLDQDVCVPRVLEQDLGQGFLLLTDLGNTTYLQALQDDHSFERADGLYRDAIETLIQIQADPNANTLPVYDHALLRRELDLFTTWYIQHHLGKTLTESQHKDLELVFERILENNLAQPRVTVHRDYHSRNLMVLESDYPGKNPGVLDFQDAVFGPVTYDLVSLLRDAYIEWDEEIILDWAIRYWEKARKAKIPVAADFGTFWQDFEWMGLQRHLKVLGIFARLYHRDGKDRYLADLPLVLRYTHKVCSRYSALAPLRRLIDNLHERSVATGYTF